MAKPCDVFDYQRLARRRVPRMFYDYADSGSWTESTYRANTSDFDRLKFRQRVAVDMSDRNLASTMVGQPVSMPLALAPTGLTGLQWADGEIHAARAAEKAGVPFTLSTMSICSIEEVAAHTTKPFWFQLYVMRDRDFIARLIDRARAAGCSALVVTLDLQILGQRHKDVRNGLSAPPSFSINSLLQIMARPGWAMRMLGTKRRGFGNVIGHVKGIENMTSLSEWSAKQLDPKLSWDDIAWIRERWDGPVILKGIMDPEDARLAVKTGADAIIVSNHGGRQLDGAPSSIEMLPAILDAVGDDIEVHFDGGIRTGQAILKALCLGAKSTYIGRPFLYGLGAAGEAGVSDVLSILRNELDVSMALCGERDIQNVGRHNLFNPDVYSL
jgi:L-lactate dehydrogenase (cytochrome)